MKIGACLSFTDSDLKKTAQEAILIGANTFMMYIGSPTQYKKPTLNKVKIADGLDFMKAKEMTAENIILHTNYLSNFASPEESKRITAMNSLVQEIELAKQVGIKYLVCHPGNYVKGTREQGLINVANCINNVLEESDDVMILLENSAGQGTSIFNEFIEFQCIMEKITLKDKVGVCLDCNHAFAAGYDIVNNLDEVLEEFEGLIELDKLLVTHISDSKYKFNSRKDRHKNIGCGEIGSQAIYNFVHHPLLIDKIHILETNIAEDGGNNYQKELLFLNNDSFNPQLL